MSRGYFSRLKTDFGTAPRWGRLLVVLFLVAVVAVGMAMNRSSTAVAALEPIDRIAAAADGLAAKARSQAWTLSARLDEPTFVAQPAKLRSAADETSLLFFQANEAFGNAIVASLRTLKEPLSDQTRKAVELKIRLFTAQSRAAAAAGSACAIPADEANTDFAEVLALMEEHEANVVSERDEVDRIDAELKKLTAAATTH